MIIIKIINNNTVIAKDESDNKVILTGKGIGFQMKRGDEAKTELIFQKFILDEQGEYERYCEMIRNISKEIFPVAEKIIYHARTCLGKSFSDSVYLTLSDHLNFAIDRIEKGITFENALHYETKNFYPDEYKVGLHALVIVEQELHIVFPEHEASFIALHFVNAQLHENMSQTYQITKFMQDIQNIVKYHFQVVFDENSLNYYRFITHLKFFAKRIFDHEQFQDNDDLLLTVIQTEMPEYYACTMKVHAYIQSQYHIDFSKQEAIYFTIHLKRVLSKKGEKL